VKVVCSSTLGVLDKTSVGRARVDWDTRIAREVWEQRPELVYAGKAPPNDKGNKLELGALNQALIPRVLVTCKISEM
jgi:hypothetical protein